MKQKLGGIWIILTALLLGTTTVLIRTGFQTMMVYAGYGAGVLGLLLTTTLIHLRQSGKARIIGSLSYFIAILALVVATVPAFTKLAEMAGIPEAKSTYLATWGGFPVVSIGAYGPIIGLVLLGISIISAGSFPTWSGILIGAGAVLQIPSQTLISDSGPLLILSSIGGVVLCATGLIWIGWIYWENNLENQGSAFSRPERIGGGLLVIFTGLILAVDAVLNMFGSLSLTSATTHIVSYTCLVLTSYVLIAAQGEKAGWIGVTGFNLVHLGAALYFITASMIIAQLAGVIDNNVMLMASWDDLPLGRIGGYMTSLGLLLLGIESTRTGIFPAWSGWLVVSGIALTIPFTLTIQAYYLGIFWVIGASIAGIGIAGMGWVLLTKIDNT